MNTPPDHLTPSELENLKHSVLHEGEFIFKDEYLELEVDSRHLSIANSYLEVTPKELIDVAKHIATSDSCHKESIKQAYALICQAHRTSRTIATRNQEMRYNSADPRIINLIENCPKDDDGRPVRKDLLEKLYAKLGRKVTQASRDFNLWLKQRIRLDDFRYTISTVRTGKKVPFEKEPRNPWIKLHYYLDEPYLILPVNTKPRNPTPPRNAEPGEHVTAPYWDTDDIWFPETDEDSVKEIEGLIYHSGRKSHFTDVATASRLLNRFVKYLNIQDQINSEIEPTSVKRHKSKDTGQYVSPSNNGSKRDKDGTYTE